MTFHAAHHGDEWLNWGHFIQLRHPFSHAPPCASMSELSAEFTVHRERACVQQCRRDMQTDFRTLFAYLAKFQFFQRLHVQRSLTAHHSCMRNHHRSLGKAQNGANKGGNGIVSIALGHQLLKAKRSQKKYNLMRCCLPSNISCALSNSFLEEAFRVSNIDSMSQSN